MSASRALVAALSALFLVACGSSEPAAAGPGDGDDGTGGGEEPGGGGGGEPGGGGGEDIPWAQRTKQQKAAFMNEVVLPQMRSLFQEFDAQEFAEVNCATCHGSNAREVEFRMPNTLHPLNPAAMPSATSSDADEARWVGFMQQRVVPKMSELLGVAAYDPATQQGFGCFNCHATAQ